MNEKLLQYLWNYKIFKNFDFKDVDGNEIEFLEFGQWNFNSGPDFLFGKIRHKGLTIAGHIELHVKSSDWIFHQHSGNPEFENIIAHVVFINDLQIEEFQSRNIPTVVLQNHIDESLIYRYEELIKETQFIPCEKNFDPNFLPPLFHEENLLKKLDGKSAEHELTLKQNQNNYEALLFQQLAYAFGLKINAPIFKQLAASLDFKVVNKVRQNKNQLEALFFGCCGWLEKPADNEMAIWKREYDFLKSKFNIGEHFYHPKFSRLRPPNFPTLRLSQLATLYHQHQNLFSKLIFSNTIEELRMIFQNVKASSYWDERFNFGKLSPAKGAKIVSEDFIDLVLINAVLPVKYTYFKNTDENAASEILTFYTSLHHEKNTITEQWKALKVPVHNALASQSLIYHYKHNCQPKNCLKCGVGLQILNAK